MTRKDKPSSAVLENKRSPRRRLWLVLVWVVGTIAVLLGATYVWLISSGSVQTVGTPNCQDVLTESAMGPSQEFQARAGVCDATERLAAAWEEQDAEAYGAVFTENATYTTFAGTYYDGREDIIRSHAALYDGPLSETRLADRYLGLRFFADDIAVLTTRGDTYEGDMPDHLSKVQTYTLIRDDDQWKVAAFQNTQRKELMEKIQFLWMDETRPESER